jgi:hypothetical protein
MQVSMLQMNAGIGRAVTSADTLDRQNSTLRADISQLDSGEQIQKVATELGMVMPAAGDVRFLDARQADGARAAANVTAPAPVSATQAAVAPAPAGQAPAAAQPQAAQAAQAAAPPATATTASAAAPPATTQPQASPPPSPTPATAAAPTPGAAAGPPATTSSGGVSAPAVQR